MELHHPIMSKLWNLGGQTKRKKERKINRIYFRAITIVDIIKGEVNIIQDTFCIFRCPADDITYNFPEEGPIYR